MADPLVVAIDGPVGSGKTTVARMVAERLGFSLVDTGAIYRCLALQARRRGVDWDDVEGLVQLAGQLEIEFVTAPEKQLVMCNGEDVSEAIRLPDISQGASVVSAHPRVRQSLLELQRRLAARGGVVMEGRDIGTVVWPKARLKAFLQAPDEVRARRRFAELQEKGVDTDYAATLEQLRQRDQRDRNRTVAPLKPAPDAVIIDTSDMTARQVAARIVSLVESRRK
ncbi:MAG: (d)CMP kinase [Deltaproteobacteria bacterium]|nr:MAG: (d)CMP kinase [Deltaproteobacteria bacterium]